MPWPVDDPPKPKLRSNLKTSVAQTAQLSSPHYYGPLNVLIALHRAQAAAVEVVETDRKYENMGLDK